MSDTGLLKPTLLSSTGDESRQATVSRTSVVAVKMPQAVSAVKRVSAVVASWSRKAAQSAAFSAAAAAPSEALKRAESVRDDVHANLNTQVSLALLPLHLPDRVNSGCIGVFFELSVRIRCSDIAQVALADGYRSEHLMEQATLLRSLSSDPLLVLSRSSRGYVQ